MRVEPDPGLGGEAAHHAAYLDFYRATCIEKCRSLPEEDLRASRLPSGWTPIELLQHLAFMERRWFVWGFLGEPVDEPWGDSQGDGDRRWAVAATHTLEDVVGLLDAGAARTRAVLEAHDLDEPGSTAGRFAGMTPPDLRWICFHVLQEYARHAGHLDVAVELAGGHTGE
ncbi:DinB family protein [Nocardioides sp. LS1]|uniref:DinB family protein n=1 Tax=Nocardioides sp. LS1 TaxID=1027620 RepID=UPI000F627738|nr:DinB family protein [Nocardioides sp. LS1]GCD91372.1 hypothetical protein NLS1_33780 [Nocardioides sp. LS1]